MGSFQLLETAAMTTPSMMMYPIDTHGGGISSFDLSKTGQAMAFGDTLGWFLIQYRVNIWLVDIIIYTYLILV
jgi:hypothetical protein